MPTLAPARHPRRLAAASVFLHASQSSRSRAWGMPTTCLSGAVGEPKYLRGTHWHSNVPARKSLSKRQQARPKAKRLHLAGELARSLATKQSDTAVTPLHLPTTGKEANSAILGHSTIRSSRAEMPSCASSSTLPVLSSLPQKHTRDQGPSVSSRKPGRAASLRSFSMPLSDMSF